METINLGIGDDLPPVDWSTIVERIADGSPPAPDAHNARTTRLTTLEATSGSLDVTVWVHVGSTALPVPTGAGTKKHHYASDPRCSIAVSVRDADVVVTAAPPGRQTPPAMDGQHRAGRTVDGRPNPMPT